MRIEKEKICENLITIFVIGIIAFCFLLESPMHPWVNTDSGVDSSVFQTVALMMKKGGMPYRDSFDHKGPLLYILNWIGNQFLLPNGIWIIELVSLVITFFTLYKLARLVTDKKRSGIALGLSTTLLFKFFEKGNMTEEYAMPFIAISLYFFVDYFLNGKITNGRLILAGLGLGATLLLRPNMISVWVVFCVIVFIQILKDRNFEKLRRFLIWFLLGLAMILIPVVFWLYRNDALIACWNDYIIFNMKYVSKEAGRAIVQLKCLSFIHFFLQPVCLVAVSTMTYVSIKKKDLFHIGYVVYLLVTFYFICMSGMRFNHYGMILIPSAIYPLALLLNEISSTDKLHVKSAGCLCVFILFVLCLRKWESLMIDFPVIYQERNEDHTQENSKIVAEIVKTYTAEDDKISVYGNWNYVYLIANRRHATRYSYQFPIGQVKPKLMEEYFQELEDELPKAIIVDANCADEQIIAFLEKHSYDMLWNDGTKNGASVYCKF